MNSHKDQSPAKVMQSFQIPIPTIGYFSRIVYISTMHVSYRNRLMIVLGLGLFQWTGAQDASYILKSQSFKEAPSAINFSPDASLLLTGYTDGTIRIMDPESFQVSLERKNAHFKEVKALDMSPAMDLIMSAGHNTIHFWDLQGNKVETWGKHATNIWNAEISRNGKWAVSSAFNKTFLLWDVKQLTFAESMRGHKDVCLAVSISPDNRWIASGSKDQTLKIWDLETRALISTLEGPAELVYDLEFSPDSRLLATASQDETIRIYEVDSTNLLYILKGHQESVMEVEFSPDGRYLLSGSADHSLMLWDLRSGEKIYQFLAQGPVTDLVFHPNGQSFFSISSAGELVHWDLHPEIFVLRYYEEAYLKELSAVADFEPRRKGESKKDFQSRQTGAAPLRKKIVDRYYQLYLEERDH